MPRGSQPDSDAGLGTNEDDGPNHDKHTYIPPDESADESDNSMQSVESVPVPKRKKKATPAAATKKATKSGTNRKAGLTATKQLVTIAKIFEGDSDPVMVKRTKISSMRRQIMESTDSDGVNLPLRHWKPKAQGHDMETAGSESDMEAPPSKKPKGVKSAVEQESTEKPGKNKQSIREAIAAVQQDQMGASADGNGGVSEKWAAVAAKEKVRSASGY
jgi:hypothetical protein